MSHRLKAFAWSSLTACFLVGCGRVVEQTEELPGPEVCEPRERGQIYGDYVIGEPVWHQNLAVFPVASKEHRAVDRFITLDEGLKAGVVEIREMGGERLGANPSRPNAPANPAGDQSPDSQSADQLNPFREPLEAAPPGGTRQARAQQARRQLDAELAADLEPAGQQPARQEAAEEGGPSVNQLLVINRSSKTLYLMPGEVIIGGQQDRAIGREILVEATGKPTPIDVFCVEHGRWNARDEAENVGYLSTVQARAGEQLSPEQLKQLARDANEGKFVRSAGVVNKDVRLAVQGAMDQGKVWDEIAKANAKLGTKSGSGAFTANYGEDQIAARLNPYLDAIEKPIWDYQNVVGVIVAVNGKVQSVDLFESTPLFQKLWPKLLKNYALDGLAHSPSFETEQVLSQIGEHFELDGPQIDPLHREVLAAHGEKGRAECDVTAAVAFLKETCEAQVAKTDKSSGVSLTRRESENISAFELSVVPVDASGSTGDPGVGFGGAVHASAFSK